MYANDTTSTFLLSGQDTYIVCLHLTPSVAIKKLHNLKKPFKNVIHFIVCNFKPFKNVIRFILCNFKPFKTVIRFVIFVK